MVACAPKAAAFSLPEDGYALDDRFGSTTGRSVVPAAEGWAGYHQISNGAISDFHGSSRRYQMRIVPLSYLRLLDNIPRIG